jgi:hypothetical protein
MEKHARAGRVHPLKKWMDDNGGAEELAKRAGKRGRIVTAGALRNIGYSYRRCGFDLARVLAPITGLSIEELMEFEPRATGRRRAA